MDYRALIFGAVLALSGVAHAGYAQLANPERFSGSPGNWTFAPSANDARYGKIVYQPNGLRVPVPGVPTTMPAAYRFAANAPRVAAAAIYVSPHLRAAVGIASLLSVAKVFWDEGDKVWKATDKMVQTVPKNFVYGMNGVDGNYFTEQELADAFLAAKNINPSGLFYKSLGFIDFQGRRYFKYSETQVVAGITNFGQNEVFKFANACPTGWASTPAGCVSPEYGRQVKIETEEEFTRRVLNPDNQPGWPNVPADWPIPETVPFEIPGVPLPVDPPYINPEPGTNPQHRPKFIPTGDPVPNPQYDPNAPPGTANQPWYQPGVRVTPKPTANDPLRVEIEPVNRPQTGPEPVTEPDTQPDPDNPDKTKPEEQQSLCEKHPEILACQVLKDSGEKPELKTQAAEFEFTPETGFNGAAACPPPIVVNASGMNLSFSWQPFCDSLGLAKPIILAFAWLSAAFIMLGGRQT